MLTSASRGEMLTPNPNECSSTLMSITPSFLLAGFTQCHLKNWEMVKLRQRSINVQPIREKVKHVKLHVNT